MPSAIIGTVTIADGTPHSRSISETASRYEAVELVGGTYDVIAGEAHGDVRLSARVPGIVTSKYDGAEFFGVGVGSDPQHANHRDVGKQVEVSVPVCHDDVAWNDLGREVLVWQHMEYPTHVEFQGSGLTMRRYRKLAFLTSIRVHRGRVWRIDGDVLAEFATDDTTMVERVNELQAAGHDPDVWRVTAKDDHTLWFETPFEDHRPYNAQKYPMHAAPRGDSRHYWRYYTQEVA